jgi:excisionase family DNA binding protein
VSPLERKAVNVSEAARVLGLHPHTVRALVERGELYSVRVGKRILIPVAELDRFLEPQNA